MSRSILLPIHLVSTEDSPKACAEERALAGKAEAWNELVRKHNHRVVLTLLARGIRPETARDLAQEAWTRLIEQQRNGRLVKITMPGLAIKQALFLARDFARRQRDDGQLQSQHSVDPKPRLWARQRLHKASLVLQRCSKTEKRVFQAMYGEPGRCAAEVAAETGLSVQRVRQVLCEIRKRLRETEAKR